MVRDTQLVCSSETKLTSAGTRRRRTVLDHTRSEIIISKAQPVFAMADLNNTQRYSRDRQDFERQREKNILKRLIQGRKRTISTEVDGEEGS